VRQAFKEAKASVERKALLAEKATQRLKRTESAPVPPTTGNLKGLVLKRAQSVPMPPATVNGPIARFAPSLLPPVVKGPGPATAPDQFAPSPPTAVGNGLATDSPPWGA
jgi:hypothetical protein